VTLDPSLAGEAYCYLTTRGRVTGRPHEIEIWFALVDSTLYLLSGGGPRSDWVRNLIADPAVSVRIAGTTHDAHARLVTDAAESELARRLLFEKYSPTTKDDLVSWRDRALPVALDIP